ncbi:SAM-dependent methyltransferase [Streptosporangium lutulentum]|uniref:SAM-dependent MidA family methyltransferase n=1 Tax=Streptosporangium lutulentum TaxID=1461250 RepID=A0ABT9QQM9_9ACTN|nr:SAM-dependent methyltransferase [Streptosporangium lutulentum]MDP9848214.1 SAM-dependent MidA family methyltransferase [Streptosporangium lutulentum]
MWLTWRAAMEQALYGESGFYLRERPSGHFVTSVGASPAFAEAMLRELIAVDGALGHPPVVDLVDIGAGEGRLAAGMLAAAPPELRSRLRVTGVDLASRPAPLPEEIAWATVVPDAIHGLVIANEWLDNVPVDIVEQTADGPRLVMVNVSDGKERLGGRPQEDDLAWLARWWPMRATGERAEIGRPRDEAWASVIVRLACGRAIAIDYAHFADNRPPYGTLAGYRDGTTVAPVPDGSCDVTAHVALDSCARAGERAGAVTTTLTTQREALRALGVTGTRPSLEHARSDPRGYLQALTRASEEAELIAAEGLGGFGWLAQTRT